MNRIATNDRMSIRRMCETHTEYWINSHVMLKIFHSFAAIDVDIVCLIIVNITNFHCTYMQKRKNIFRRDANIDNESLLIV